MKKYILICTLPLLAACANIGSLGGGKVDDQAPKLESINIEKTNFKGDKIVLEFDEYVVLNNAEKNIILQPKHSTMTYSIARKKVIIHFDSTLKPNTTYNLMIDKGIADNNANNTFSYSVIFSTGNTIDSGKIAVNIKDYKDHKNLKIALSENDGSDSFKNFTTDYIQEANKDIIVFNGLNAKKYNLWLFTDADADQKPDLYKPLNFIENVQLDSTYSIQPRQWKEPFRITRAFTDLSVLKLKHTASPLYIQKLRELFPTITDTDIIYSNTDSSLLFSRNIPKNYLSGLSFRIDTVPVIDYHTEVRNIVKSTLQIIRVKNEYAIRFLQPQFYSAEKEMAETIIKNRKRDSFLLFPFNQRSETPDTFYLKKNNIIDYKSLSYIEINIQDKNKKDYDVIILKDDKEFLRINHIHQYQNYLPPGVYKIQVFENSVEHVFDPFILRPAPKKLYEKDVILKANWEEVLSIVLD